MGGCLGLFTTGHTVSGSTTLREKVFGVKPPSIVQGAQDSDAVVSNFKYMRMEGLGLFPGMVSPHFDGPYLVPADGTYITDPNCVLAREQALSDSLVELAEEFETLNEREKISQLELGIGIDSFAALIVNGTHFEEYFLDDKLGSVLDSGGKKLFDKNQTGRPGIVLRKLVPNDSVCSDDTKAESGIAAYNEKYSIRTIVLPTTGKCADYFRDGISKIDERAV